MLRDLGIPRFVVLVCAFVAPVGWYGEKAENRQSFTTYREKAMSAYQQHFDSITADHVDEPAILGSGSAPPEQP